MVAEEKTSRPYSRVPANVLMASISAASTVYGRRSLPGVARMARSIRQLRQCTLGHQIVRLTVKQFEHAELLLRDEILVLQRLKVLLPDQRLGEVGNQLH